MPYQTLADLVVLIHFAFVLFVGLGGLLVLQWRRIAWLHVPAAVWGAAIEFGGWICPLTPLENRLRTLGGAESYTGDFIGRYLIPLMYPAELTRELQLVLGGIVVVLNVTVYVVVWHRYRSRARRRT
jgi:hypothetical protein